MEVRVTFGSTFSLPGSAPAPEAQTMEALVSGGACRACRWVHPDGQECDLARRLRANEVPKTAVNCLGHDHCRRACPVLHYHCKWCGLLGHTEQMCKWRSVEYSFRVFMQHCCDGRFTSSERRGPFPWIVGLWGPCTHDFAPCRSGMGG